VPEVDRLPPLQREIAEAHLRYWDVRSRAYDSLDTSRLKDVLAGAPLAREEEYLRQRRAEGRAFEMDAELSFEVVDATPDRAVVYEEFLDRGGDLDAATRRRVAPDEPPDWLAVVFWMTKTDGVWKVVRTAGHSDPDTGSTPTATPVPTRPLSLVEEVSEACGRYWRILRRARRDLDPSRLDEAMAGAALARARGEIGELRTAGRTVPLRGQVFDYVLKATPDEGVCYAEYIDDGVRRDATTGQGLGPRPTPSLVRSASYLKKLLGQWKVVDAADVGRPLTAGSREQEIADAYRRYRRALVDAYARMDPAPLGQAAAGRKLAEEQRLLAERAVKGYAVRLDGGYGGVVVRAAPDEGIVFDRYLDRRTWVELGTGKETTREPASIKTASFSFRLEDGVWKAVDGSAFPDETPGQ
jgi:hypothetical protein